MALRPKLNRVWTSNNSIARRDPGDAKYLQGWVAEIPTYQVLNYLQYKVDTTMLAQAERGIFEWGNDVSYGIGSLAWDETNKTIYVCTVTNPSKTLAPSANPSQWSPSSIQVSRANYDSIVSAINNHIANRANPHQVTAAQVGTYNRAEMDALVANYRAMVQAHVTDYNNPHKLTAVQVGAVPVEGGTYTGEVTMPTAYFNKSKTAQLLQDNGLWLKNGSYLLGINGTTGNPETGTAASKSRIVTELNFPDVKLAQEPGYSTPLESFQMGLINSINIQRGTGTAITEGEPTYDLSTGMMGVNDVEFKLAALDVMQLPSNTAFTICFDYLHTFTPGQSAWSIVVGMDFARILVRKSGAMFIYINPTSGAQMAYASTTIPAALSGTIIRIAGSYDGTTYRLYVNGVLVASQAGAPSAGGSKPSIYIPKWPDTVRIKNFRLWPSALTDKQVSTL